MMTCGSKLSHEDRQEFYSEDTWRKVRTLVLENTGNIRNEDENAKLVEN